MSIVIGLTGTTGAGKSSCSKIAEDLGYKVIDCDKTARKATEKGTEGLKALAEVFGKEILLADGSLNRKALAAKAFASKEKTELLNKTLLPFIVMLLKKEIKGGYVLLDAPTLFESGMNDICTKTVAILADREVRLKRIIERDNLTIKEAETRVSAGKPYEFYKQKTDYVIFNNGDEASFLNEFTKIIKEITEAN